MGGGRIVEVRRSSRRRRTVSAYRDGSRTIVLVPARMSVAEERRWVERMLARLDAQEHKRRPSDDDLLSRARELSHRYLSGRAEPSSVRWVGNQEARWGSCTPADSSIRLSRRLQGMPGWVIDYVLVHELAHLLVPGHGAAFWRLVEGFPRMERARGYLEGVAAASGSEPGTAPSADMDDDVDDVDEIPGADGMDELDDVGGSSRAAATKRRTAASVDEGSSS